MMSAFTASQLVAAASILRSWKASNPITSSERAEKIHEVFVAIGLAAEVVKKATSLGGVKLVVELLDSGEVAKTKFTPRTNPGVLGSKNAKRYGDSPTFIRIRFEDSLGRRQTIEVHQSVRWLDSLGVGHEADVAVLNHALTSYKIAVPVREQIALTVECKLWRGKASLGSAREAEAFHYWVGSHVHVLAHSGPKSPSVDRFISAVGRRLYYFHGVADPHASATRIFFNNAVASAAAHLGL